MAKRKQKIKCTAIVEHDRIQLIINKKDKGYNEFAKVINKIDKKGVMIWYGDVEDENFIETSGLVITHKLSD
jgi:hypothetical protein